MFLNIQIDLIILKPDDEQFTLTTKKNLVSDIAIFVLKRDFKLQLTN